VTVIQVDLANEQTRHNIDEELVCRAVRTVLEGEQIPDVIVSLAVVDDPTIHKLNREYLGHDYATDVLSFLLSDALPSDTSAPLEGEVIVSADTASRRAAEFGWQMQDELLLYVIHGTLHLAGFDDKTDADRAVMRAKEEQYLRSLGRTSPAAEGTASLGRGGSAP
jgi:probable rRNA maturation factor